MVKKILMAWRWLFAPPADVSPAWLRDNDRRLSSIGVDQSRWAVWPWKDKA